MKKKFFDGFTPKDDIYKATMFRVLKHVRYGAIFHELFTNSHRNSLNQALLLCFTDEETQV